VRIALRNPGRQPAVLAAKGIAQLAPPGLAQLVLSHEQRLFLKGQALQMARRHGWHPLLVLCRSEDVQNLSSRRGRGGVSSAARCVRDGAYTLPHLPRLNSRFAHACRYRLVSSIDAVAKRDRYEGGA